MARLPRSSYLKRTVKMNALRKGLIGGSPVWRTVWVLSAVRKFWSKVSKKGEAPVVFEEDLDEGTAWTLVHVPENSRHGRKLLSKPSAERVNSILGVDMTPPPTRRERRKAKKAAKAEAA
ncbi:MAG: hypothetical protein HKN94_07355 [Acidimicrobiales bacterium]|nr:hypothetical protein [Acidimicrobiales bacterium]RZV46519.1 MAG: hypothetical protein EX269_07055 [Acidimicrobiales bacterium]